MRERGGTAFCTLVLRKRTLIGNNLAHMSGREGVSALLVGIHLGNQKCKPTEPCFVHLEGGLEAFWPQYFL